MLGCYEFNPLRITESCFRLNRGDVLLRIGAFRRETMERVNFQAVADNLCESFRVIAASRSAGELRELRGVSIASAGVTFQMFNAAFLAAPVRTEAELSQRIQMASLHFQNRGLEWAYWLC